MVKKPYRSKNAEYFNDGHTSAEQEELRRQIQDQPDDDAPRLKYADWLEEHGDPRAEFIRLNWIC